MANRTARKYRDQRYRDQRDKANQEAADLRAELVIEEVLRDELRERTLKAEAEVQRISDLHSEINSELLAERLKSNGLAAELEALRLELAELAARGERE